MSIHGPNAGPQAAVFRMLKEVVGQAGRELPAGDGARATAFRHEIEKWIALARDASDPIRIWFDIGSVEARVLLAFSRGSRKSSKSTVDMYARDMSSGAWKRTAQGFAFARSGWFGDGHDRCRAVIDSGQTIRTAIDFGVDDSAMACIDSGRRRSIFYQFSVARAAEEGGPQHERQPG